MKLGDTLDDVNEEYEPKDKEQDGYLHCEVRKGIYDLPQAGLVSQGLVEKILKTHDYYQITITPGFWKHKWQPVSFFTGCA